MYINQVINLVELGNNMQLGGNILKEMSFYIATFIVVLVIMSGCATKERAIESEKASTDVKPTEMNEVKNSNEDQETTSASVTESTEDGADEKTTSTDNKSAVVRTFLESANDLDKETFSGVLVNDLDLREELIENFFSEDEVYKFDIIEMIESIETPDDYQDIPKEKLAVFDAKINMTQGDEIGEIPVSVILYKEIDGWKVLDFY